MNRRFLLIYCALNAAFALLGLALCGGGFFGTGSFGVRALAWLLSLEAGFLGAFGAIYFSFRAYRNKIEDELRAGKYDEILQQSSKNSACFISSETSSCDTNSTSHGENRGDASSGDKISYGKTCGCEILNSENFSGANSGVEISNAQNSEDAVNFTSSETRTENGDSCALHDEIAAEHAANSTERTASSAGCAADKFKTNDGKTCGNSQSDIDDEASDSSQDGIDERCDDLKGGASGDLDDGVDSGGWSDGADRNNHSDGAGNGKLGAAVRDKSKDGFEGTDDFEGELERSEVRSNFAGAFFSPFKILSYAALVAAIYLLAKLSLLNPLAIILGVTIIPLGTMIAALADKDAR